MSQEKSFQESLWKLIKDIRYAMMTHRHADGKLHSHPMTTQNRSLDPGDPLYFFVSRKSELGQRIQADGNVCVNYADHDKDVYVCISGQATVSEDLATKKRLFN